MKPSSRAPDWLRQAQSDLRFAAVAHRDGFFAQAFVRAAEEALR